MARLEARIWQADFAGMTRRDRRSCHYSVYLPDHLAGRRFVLDAASSWTATWPPTSQTPRPTWCG